MLSQQRKPSRFQCNLQSITSKGAILVLIWITSINMFWQMMISSINFVVHSNPNHSFYIFDNTLTAVNTLPLLFCPIGGLIADHCTGRYRMIITSIYITLFTWIVFFITCIVWYAFGSATEIISIVSLITGSIFLIGFGGFQSVAVPYNVDQLMDSSTEEISAFINWQMFCYFVVKLTAPCVLIYVQSSEKGLVIVSAAGAIILGIVISHCILKKYLNTLQEITSPIKQLYNVLAYAKNNKYPKNRSALTYWESDYPSRIDFGKERFAWWSFYRRGS